MGCLKKYETVQDILKEFFDLRLHYYSLRKEWLVGMLGAESTKLNNQARFILEKIQGKITIGELTEVRIVNSGGRSGSYLNVVENICMRDFHDTDFPSFCFFSPPPCLCVSCREQIKKRFDSDVGPERL